MNLVDTIVDIYHRKGYIAVEKYLIENVPAELWSELYDPVRSKLVRMGYSFSDMRDL